MLFWRVTKSETTCFHIVIHGYIALLLWFQDFLGYNLSSLHIITFPLSVCCEGIWSGPIDTTSRYIEFDTDRCPGHQKQCPITVGTRYVKKLQTSPSDFSNYCISKANISINIHVVNKKSMNYFAMLISLFSKKNNIELKIVILMIIFR